MAFSLDFYIFYSGRTALTSGTTVIKNPLFHLYTFSVPRTATSLEITPIAMPDPRSDARMGRK